jgi:hypothetical protein
MTEPQQQISLGDTLRSAVEQAMQELLPALPAMPSPEAAYDGLMAAIEPELTSPQIGGLKEKYKKEKAVDRQKRMARYQAAFQAYKNQFADYAAAMHQTVRTFQRMAIGIGEALSATQDQNALDALSSQFSS